MHVVNQTQSFRRNPKKLKSLFSCNKQRSKDIKHFTTACEIKSYQGHLQKHKPQEMITQYACNKLISWPLNIRLSAAKTRFTQSKFRMLQVMHCVVLVTFARERKRKRTTVQADSQAGLSRSRFTLSRAYESCLACQHLFLTVKRGWPHHWGLRPLLSWSSGVCSFTFHMNWSVPESAVTPDLRVFVLIREN